MNSLDKIRFRIYTSNNPKSDFKTQGGSYEKQCTGTEGGTGQAG